jgi:hypothetical protein
MSISVNWLRANAPTGQTLPITLALTVDGNRWRLDGTSVFGGVTKTVFRCYLTPSSNTGDQDAILLDLQTLIFPGSASANPSDGAAINSFDGPVRAARIDARQFVAAANP